MANCEIDNNITLEELLKDFVSEFNHIGFAFGYGSDVFVQDGYSVNSKKMTDIIMAIDDSKISIKNWHLENMRNNPQMYNASLTYMMKHFPDKFQNWVNGTIFTTLSYRGKKIKLGITTVSNLKKDCQQKHQNYIAGRSQKMIKVIIDNVKMDEYIKKNRTITFLETLLRMKSEFDHPIDFHRKQTWSTYLGDIRFLLLAENPWKVKNIVNKSYRQLDQMYPMNAPEISHKVTGNIIYNKEGLCEVYNRLDAETKKAIFNYIYQEKCKLYRPSSNNIDLLYDDISPYTQLKIMRLVNNKLKTDGQSKYIINKDKALKRCDELPEDLQKKLANNTELVLNRNYIATRLRRRDIKSKNDYFRYVLNLEVNNTNININSFYFGLLKRTDQFDNKIAHKLYNSAANTITRHYAIKNFKVSSSQIVKGFLTVGPIKSTQYALAKLGKGILWQLPKLIVTFPMTLYKNIQKSQELKSTTTDYEPDLPMKEKQKKLTN